MQMMTKGKALSTMLGLFSGIAFQGLSSAQINSAVDQTISFAGPLRSERIVERLQQSPRRHKAKLGKNKRRVLAFRFARQARGDFENMMGVNREAYSAMWSAYL